MESKINKFNNMMAAHVSHMTEVFKDRYGTPDDDNTKITFSNATSVTLDPNDLNITWIGGNDSALDNIYTGDKIGGGYDGYGGRGWTGDIPWNTNKPWTGDDYRSGWGTGIKKNDPIVPGKIDIVANGGSIVDQFEELQRKVKELEGNKPNKVDKDLVSGKLPYNVSADIHKNLTYEFAVAGYTEDRIKVLQVKDGLEIKLLVRDDSDDLMGEEKEYICKGIKDGNQTEHVFIDRSQYDVENCECELDNGVLKIYVPYKEKQKVTVKKTSRKVNIN